MKKCEVFDSKQTRWSGLWYHQEYRGFSSAAMNLSVFKQFKGAVRLYVRKNYNFNGGENGRPNYIFCLKDSKSPTFTEMEVIDEQLKPYLEDGDYYTGDGQRLYTYDEVQYAINRAAEDGRRGYGAGDNIVSDYLPTN